MDRILLVSDDEGLKQNLTSRLTDLGLRPFAVSPGERALAAIWREHPDLIFFHYQGNSRVLRAFCREIKEDEETRGIPLVALILGEDSGGFDLWEMVEDFIILPCHPKEFRLRIQQIWRKRGLNLPGEHFRVGDLAIDFVGYEVLLQGTPVALTYKEYELLKFLATHPNRVFSRNTLLRKVWGYEAYVGTRTVDIHIRRLRSKLGAVGSGIQTVRNVGYKFSLKGHGKQHSAQTPRSGA